MKVLSIGTDRKIFEEGSAVRERMVEYGKLFEKLEIIVFSKRIMNYESRPTESFGQARIMLSDNVFVYPTNSRNRFWYVVDAIKIGKKIIHDSKFLIHNSVLSTQDPFETGLVGLLLKLRYKLPLQIQLHTDFANRHFISHSFLNFIRFPLGIFVLSFADSVRVVSKRIEKLIHSLAHNVSVLPIHTESRIMNYELRKYPKKINFLSVCRLEKEKDLGTAIKAFKKISDDGVEATFTIVGDGSERKKLEELTKNYNLQSKIFFVGWQNDLTKFYEEADIYVSTSLYEGYGMSSVEAASYGLALILSDAGLSGDIFSHNTQALVCKQKDVAGFAEAMKKLGSDFSLLQKMGKAARDVALAHQITWPDYLTKYKSSMKEAIDFNLLGISFFKKNILIRYFVAGITAASTNIGLLYIFTDIFKIWYLYSSILSFAIGIIVSFVLQKFWTFRDQETEKIHHQALMYLGVALLGLGFNTVLMYGLVDILGIWYILAQVITGACIMVFNFLMYKFFIFNKQ